MWRNASTQIADWRNIAFTLKMPDRGFERKRLISTVWSILPHMRTLPKALSAFREIVNERGARLRGLSFEELSRLGTAPIEHLSVESRPATIGIIVQPLETGGIQFYKYPDGTVAPMPSGGFSEFD